jgi:glyoxylase-like metal-dependent hydrolase (beta-lactamase superfamily II)
MPTVTPLCCGSLTLDKSILVAGATGIEIEAPSTIYLIEAEETILVDTSFGDLDLMADLHPTFDCRRPPERTLPAVLDHEGYAPEDVDRVVLSHLDWDHCYNLDRFVDAGAEVCVQRAELEYAIAPYPMHAARYDAKSLGREPPWLDVPLSALDGETELCDGVVAFPTPGHTIGHQSVAVETPAGTVVAAADAIPTFENLAGTDDAPLIRGAAMNDFEWWRSAQAVTERADEVLPGHEWTILDAAPSNTNPSNTDPHEN